MASAINPITAASTSTTAAANSGAAPPTQEMFLQLLVSQLQNQDPLNPTDSTQFVSQLAQISELEQVIGIRGDIETQMANGSTTAATSNSVPAAASNSNTGQVPANQQIIS